MEANFNLNGKVALVTGAGRGIGRTFAEGLANAGANVVLVSRTLEEVEQAAAEITNSFRKENAGNGL